MSEENMLDSQNVEAVKLFVQSLITLDYSKFYTEVVATSIAPVNYTPDSLSISGDRIVFFDYIHEFLNLTFLILVQYSEPSFYIAYKIALKHSFLSVPDVWLHSHPALLNILINAKGLVIDIQFIQQPN